MLGENTALQDLPHNAVISMRADCEQASKGHRKVATPPAKGWEPPSPQARVREGSCYVPPELRQAKSNSPSCGRELSGTLISDDATQHKRSRGGRARERLITPCLLDNDSLKDELFPTWLLKNTY